MVMRNVGRAHIACSLAAEEEDWHQRSIKVKKPDQSKSHSDSSWYLPGTPFLVHCIAPKSHCTAAYAKSSCLAES